MGRVWLQSERVQVLHPGSACITGHASVMESWECVLASGPMDIDLRDVRVCVAGT